MSVSIEVIAEQTLRWPFRMWSFGEAIALEGLLEASTATQRLDYRRHVESLCLATLARGVGRSAEDHLAPGRAFLKLHAITGDERLLKAAADLVALHERLPSTPGGALLVRAHQPGWAHQIWVDSMDIIGPLYAAFATASGEHAWLGRGVELMLAHARHLQDANGLFMHGYDMHAGANGHFWARGEGWALLGMADVLRALGPSASSDAQDLLGRCRALVEALVRTQRASGLWTIVIDHPETYEETSLAAMFVHGLNMLERAGITISQTAREARATARAAVRRHVDSVGALGLVSSATPVGQLSTYATRPFGIYPWGQGPLLLMECSSSLPTQQQR
jgi:unsaturated rhamnogalacturonyl hydrolase